MHISDNIPVVSARPGYPILYTAVLYNTATGCGTAACAPQPRLAINTPENSLAPPSPFPEPLPQVGHLYLGSGVEEVGGGYREG